MEKLLKRYHDVRLVLYTRKLAPEYAVIAAQYALEDMASECKRKSENISPAYAKEYLVMELEDLEAIL